MDGPEQLSDRELLEKLRLDYFNAMHAEDYVRINNVIAPQFWGRFGRYYGEYERSWRNPFVSRLPVSVVIDPGQNKQAQIDWMEQVLTGQIDPFP